MASGALFDTLLEREKKRVNTAMGGGGVEVSPGRILNASPQRRNKALHTQQTAGGGGGLKLLWTPRGLLSAERCLVRYGPRLPLSCPRNRRRQPFASLLPARLFASLSAQRYDRNT